MSKEALPKAQGITFQQRQFQGIFKRLVGVAEVVLKLRQGVVAFGRAGVGRLLQGRIHPRGNFRVESSGRPADAGNSNAAGGHGLSPL